MSVRTAGIALACLLITFAGCDKDEYLPEIAPIGDAPDEALGTGEIPEGYFEVTFKPASPAGGTRVAIGPDDRVQHVRYVVYNKATGAFVKERVLPEVSVWPLAAVRDTLPKGEYRAIFLGNTHADLFNPELDDSVLENYQEFYANARIQIPPTEFTSTTEYYFENVEFSDAQPAPAVLLQRIIGRVKLSRLTADVTDLLNTLVENLFTELNYDALLGETVKGLLDSDMLLGPIWKTIGVDSPSGILNGALGTLLDPLLEGLVGPITEALHDILVQRLVEYVGELLDTNTDAGGISNLTALINPWGVLAASSTLLSIDDFPSAINLDLQTTDYFPDNQQFKIDFDPTSALDERYITIKGFAGDYHVDSIQVLSAQTLVEGLVVNSVVDEYLLTGTFINITDPLTISVRMNESSQLNYSLLDIDVKDDTVGEPYPFQLDVRLGDLANLDDAVSNLIETLPLEPVDDLLTIVNLIPFLPDISLEALLDGITGALLDLELNIDLPINLPLLNIDNLKLTGGWNPQEPW